MWSAANWAASCLRQRVWLRGRRVLIKFHSLFFLSHREYSARRATSGGEQTLATRRTVPTGGRVGEAAFSRVGWLLVSLSIPAIWYPHVSRDFIATAPGSKKVPLPSRM